MPVQRPFWRGWLWAESRLSSGSSADFRRQRLDRARDFSLRVLFLSGGKSPILCDPENFAVFSKRSLNVTRMKVNLPE
jgi:hypothetical protein